MQAHMKVSAIAILFMATLLQVACDNETNSGVEYINRKIDSSTSVKQITLSNLVKDYNSLDGQTIQTEGITYFEFENVAVCTRNGKDSKCFWLDLNRDLPINDSIMMQLSGQKLIIKGTVDATSKGHLNAYIATLRNVYYLKVK